MDNRITILLADKQPLTQTGFTTWFANHPQLKLAATVHEGKNFLSLVKEHQPDVVLVDYNLSDYISDEQLQNLLDTQKRVLIITDDDDSSRILRWVSGGVQGFLTKKCSYEEIILAVQTVTKGEKFFCNKVLDILLQQKTVPSLVVAKSSLSDREKEILTWLARGKSTQAIATKLSLSPHTVHSHRKNISKKLNIKSPTEYVVHALDLGLLSKP